MAVESRPPGSQWLQLVTVEVLAGGCVLYQLPPLFTFGRLAQRANA